MKTFVIAVAAASALVVPLSAFCQTDASPTRAQVRAELEKLEQAGYNPAKDDPNYPVDIQTAQARVSAQSGATGYGGVMSGASTSGSRTVVQPASSEELKQIYFGGQ
ncbi:DUF4148 domain-containing protein [Caballeronia novacaledonica]|jgi:hypothetical protein|uniref:DUF4148 domain-containing protein n=1 Tax=Caballeronia novacaledonica TaxID=1544861 RepID=A0AA37MI95_9BURK|nr:DUF4148 domain-containing protein [Caballeronia novacaledonica]GJH27448.1 DUF4148 domain-containing protein [Caballeronia novacaledonica]